MRITVLMLCAVTLSGQLARAQEAKLDPAKLEELTGLKGKLNEKENVFKVSLPRKDIQAKIAGVKATPGIGLTAWAAFTPMADHLMVMGDLVLLEEQVNPVMSVALEQGLEVTALHNHFFWDSPKVMFMHIGGMGDPQKLASSVGAVFKKIQETSQNQPRPALADLDPAKSTLDPRKIDEALGSPGELKDGVYKVTIGRTTRMRGHEIGKEMGVNTWAAFIGSDRRAVVDGDFAMLEGELQGVLNALRKSGILVVAIHNHMTQENPRIIFLHFWGVGPAPALARGVRLALDVQKH